MPYMQAKTGAITMTQFERNFSHYANGIEALSVGICEGCEDEDCHSEDYEASFSWAQCDTCGSTLGGDRYPAHGIIDGNIYHFEVCVDCVMYMANGEVPEDEVTALHGE
jgi:hypothetical protein